MSDTPHRTSSPVDIEQMLDRLLCRVFEERLRSEVRQGYRRYRRRADRQCFAVVLALLIVLSACMSLQADRILHCMCGPSVADRTAVYHRANLLIQSM